MNNVNNSLIKMYSNSDKLEMLSSESMIDVMPFTLNISTTAVFPNEVVIPLPFYDLTNMEDVKESEELALTKIKQQPSIYLTLVRKLYGEYQVTNRYYRCETLMTFLYIDYVNYRTVANSLPNCEDALSLLVHAKLPPQIPNTPNIVLVLDLDETLISSSANFSEDHNLVLTINSNDISYNVLYFIMF